MSYAVVLICLVTILVGTATLEGTTVARCTRVLGPAGPARLARVGWSFLLTEVWFVAFLGLGHAALPHVFHQVLIAAWVPISCYGLGWMIRDVGLWQVALLDRVRWAPAVAVGAWLQAIAGLGAGALTVIDFLGRPPVLAAESAATLGLLAVVAPLCILLVGGLQVWWWLLTRRMAPASG